MVKSIHKISKAFLLVMCLSAFPATMMAEVEEAQNSQIEMGQNQKRYPGIIQIWFMMI